MGTQRLASSVVLVLIVLTLAIGLPLLGGQDIPWISLLGYGLAVILLLVAVYQARFSGDRRKEVPLVRDQYFDQAMR